MNIITIPKINFSLGDLVIVPRVEYESLMARAVPEFTPTKEDLKALAQGRRDFRAGKTISLAQLKHDLANRN